jgi:hypothetical protein
MSLQGAAFDPRIITLLHRAAVALEPLGGYAIGDAFAMRAHGYARYTSDIDVFVLEDHRVPTLRALRGVGLTIEPVFAPHHFIAYLPEHNDPQVRIDVLFPVTEPELSAIESPKRASFAGVDVNVFPITLLVASKFYSDRPEDHHDIAAMLNRGMFDPIEVRQVIASIDLEGAMDFATEIEDLRRVRAPRNRPVCKK